MFSTNVFFFEGVHTLTLVYQLVFRDHVLVLGEWRCCGASMRHWGIV